METRVRIRIRPLLLAFLIVLLCAFHAREAFAFGNADSSYPIPSEAKEEDISAPDHIIGTGTPESCTAEAFIAAVAKGGTIVFNGGAKPFTITLDRPAKVFNNQNPDVVIDGGGLVTLSGGNKTRILYMNTADPKQVWTTDHAQNQDHPRLTVQNITFANGNSSSETEYDGGGAIWVRGGRFKVVNCRFINNVCASEGPDVGGGAIRVFDQYEDLPVYVVNSTFGGAPGLGNVGSNGGAISSIGVSWTLINSVFSYNKAIGNGGNPQRAGTPGGGSGGAIYNDGNFMTLTLLGTRVEYNEVNAHGSGIFFVTNDHSGEILLDGATVANNRGGSWYPVLPDISMHADTSITVKNKLPERLATPSRAKVIVDGKEISFDAFLIKGNNYFKLRDLAMAMREGEKPFGVAWDSVTASIVLTSNQRYQAIGGELAPAINVRSQPYVPNVQKIFLNGQEVGLTAYTIRGYNYFKLRDVAALFDFGVTWDGPVQSIRIQSEENYVPD